MNLKNIINSTYNYSTCRRFCLQKWQPPKNFSKLQYIPSVQKLISETVGQKLDKSSSECRYFGVDSAENIIRNIRHHAKLNKANKSWSTSNWCNGNIIDLGIISLKNIEIEKSFLHKNRGRGANGCPWSLIDEIKTQGAAKITFIDKMFEINPTGGMHTIGLVSKDNYLYVLDSLGEQSQQIKIFHMKIKELFSDAGFADIIFSTKAQQPLNEYTCNNWTFANIKSVISEIYGQNKQIKTTQELNKILREDINNILKEQYYETIQH